MSADFTPDSSTSLLPPGYLGGVQHDIHRQPQAAVRASGTSDKVNRLSCCCRISELMSLVRQLHDEARARHDAQLGAQRQQAA